MQIQKSGLSTREAIQAFAQKEYNLSTREIGYAGLKDRDAITTQWISLPTEPVSWSNDAMILANRHGTLEWARHQNRSPSFLMSFGNNDIES